jgi:hypothetical protein
MLWAVVRNFSRKIAVYNGADDPSCHPTKVIASISGFHITPLVLYPLFLSFHVPYHLR